MTECSGRHQEQHKKGKSAGKSWADVLRSCWVGVSMQPCCRTGNFAQELQKQICKEMISARGESRQPDLVEEYRRRSSRTASR